MRAGRESRPGTSNRKLARLEGFEPPTNGFGSHYSIRLSYRRPAGYCPQSRPAARVAYALPMSYERFHPAPVPLWRERLGLYWKLTRGDRPIGWLLLLWPTWWGLWIAAGGVPPWWTLVVFSLGVWLTRSAGCVINDYAARWLRSEEHTSELQSLMRISY